ncbi:DUF3313 family protein [Agaribacterium sp. ZY112]|uniref:DUF3313 family protein n=1 Tax=Agaribacterium sp. ZY112 TaxID=3233574 RepID=UPI003524E9B6
MKRLVPLKLLVSVKHLAPIVFSASLIIVSACSTPEPIVSDSPISEGPYAGMTKVDKSQFEMFYLRDGEDLTRFKAVKFDPLELDNLEINQGRLEMRDKKWDVTEEDKANLQKRFADRVASNFPSDGPIPLTDKAGKNVLSVSFEFTKFIPTASPDTGNNRAMRGSVWTYSVGGLFMNAKLYDSETGELVAYLADAREIGDRQQLQRNDSVNNSRNINLEINSWLNKLKSTMSSLAAQQGAAN